MLDGGRYQARAEAARPGRGRRRAGTRPRSPAARRSPRRKMPPTRSRSRRPSSWTRRQVARLVAAMKTAAVGGPRRKAAAPRPRQRRRSQKRRDGAAEAGADGGGDDAGQRGVRLAGGGRGASPRPGPGSARRCVCDGPKDNWAMFGVAPVGVRGSSRSWTSCTCWPTCTRAARRLQGKGTAAAWASTSAGCGWAWSGKASAAAGRLAGREPRLGGSRRRRRRTTRGGVLAEAVTYVTNNRGRMDYPRLPAAGAADQQRAGGEHDQADEPADQREREVLAGGGGGGGAAGACGLPERGRSCRASGGAAAAVSSRGGRWSAAPASGGGALTEMHPGHHQKCWAHLLRKAIRLCFLPAAENLSALPRPTTGVVPRCQTGRCRCASGSGGSPACIGDLENRLCDLCRPHHHGTTPDRQPHERDFANLKCTS